MEKTDDIKDLLTALAKAQSLIKPAVKDKINPHFKSRYASPESIQEATRDALSQNGLSVIQLIEQVDGGQQLRTILGHLSGQWISSSFRLMTTRQDMQGLGSAITYARRYAISAILNVAVDEDDDANLATEKRSPFPDEWPDTKSLPPKKSIQNLAPQTSIQKDHSANQSTEGLAGELEEELQKYTIKFGRKYMGRTLLDIGLKNAKDYLAWLMKNAEASGRESSEGVKELEKMVHIFESYIQEKEAMRSHLSETKFDQNEPWPERP